MKNLNIKRGSYLTYPYKKGDTFGGIEILEDDFVFYKNRYHVKIKCKCGNIEYKRLDHIKNMKFPCCRKCSRKNYYPEQRKNRGIFENSMHKQWLTNIKENLKRGTKTLECSITLNDLYDKLVEQNYKCIYSGITLNVLDTFKNDSNASVDRIDSDKGYIKGNIQWVYRPINIMKNGLSDKDFVNICLKIANFTRQL